MKLEQLNDRWAHATQDERRVFEQEGLILDVTEEIWKVMEEKGWNKSELASALGKSKSYVTQLMNGNRNMTLRTLSDIAFALGVSIRVALGDARHFELCWDEFATMLRIDEDQASPLPEAKNAMTYDGEAVDEMNSWDMDIQRVRVA